MDNDEPVYAASPAMSRHFTSDIISSQDTLSAGAQLPGLASLTEAPALDRDPGGEVGGQGAAQDHAVTQHHVSVGGQDRVGLCHG